MEFKVGERYFLVRRHGRSAGVPPTATAVRVNSRFVVFDNGEKANTRTGRTWGEDYYHARFQAEPWSAEREREYEEQAQFERTTRGLRNIVYLLGQNHARLQGRNLAGAELAYEAAVKFVGRLQELDVLGLPKEFGE